MGLERALLAGSVGGTVGSVLMWGLFTTATRVGWLSERPPERVIDRATAAVEDATEAAEPVEPAERTTAAVSSHLLFGAGAGAFYGLVQDKLDLPPLLTGVAYGFAIWIAAYVGVLPAARILPEPWRQRPGDALVPVAAHAIFGLSLGVIEPRISRRKD